MGNASLPNPWELPEDYTTYICQECNHGQCKSLGSLKKGAESLLFTVASEEIKIERLLKDIPLEATVIHFEFQFLAASYIQELFKFVGNKTHRIHLNIDLIGPFGKKRELVPRSLKRTMRFWKKYLPWTTPIISIMFSPLMQAYIKMREPIWCSNWPMPYRMPMSI